jgi:uncharacterized membrane protein YkvA (DUF1232 family)
MVASWRSSKASIPTNTPGLREAVQVIIQVFESSEAWQAKDPLPRWLAEVAFGARYLLKRFDFIADHLPGIGLADDARLLERILERNQLELSRHLLKWLCHRVPGIFRKLRRHFE